jgi:hypothetical protein
VVDEGVDLLRLIGVDHHAGPLVRQKEVLVLIEDLQFGLEEGKEEIVLPGLVEKFVVDVEGQHVPLPQALVPLTARAVAFDPLDADVLLQERRGQKGHRLAQEAVQPLSRVVFPDGQFSHGWASLEFFYIVSGGERFCKLFSCKIAVDKIFSK